MGTNVKSSQLKKELVKTIRNALGSLPYNVLWKYEKDDFLEQPKNVKIGKWLPQQDILGKNNSFFQGVSSSVNTFK